MASKNVKSFGLSGFTLVEVLLALGVFLVSVLALIGMLAPMLQSVDEIEKLDEINSVVNTVSAFLQSSTNIAPAGDSKFDVIFNSIQDDGFATIYVFRKYLSDTSTTVHLEIGFDRSESGVDSDAQIKDLSNAAGPIYRVVLSPSSALPEAYRSVERNEGTGTYSLSVALPQYYEGYFAMEARIFAEGPPAPGQNSSPVNKTLQNLVDTEPDFTFNIAIVR